MKLNVELEDHFYCWIVFVTELLGKRFGLFDSNNGIKQIKNDVNFLIIILLGMSFYYTHVLCYRLNFDYWIPLAN